VEEAEGERRPRAQDPPVERGFLHGLGFGRLWQTVAE
jgi:hypothetical protein